jgi:hypothetical protein
MQIAVKRDKEKRRKKGLETKKNHKNQPQKIINSAPVQTGPGADPAS